MLEIFNLAQALFGLRHRAVSAEFSPDLPRAAPNGCLRQNHVPAFNSFNHRRLKKQNLPLAQKQPPSRMQVE
jgi:hypothetical protein